MSSLQQVARLLEKPTGIPFPTIKRHIADLRTERLIAASKRGMGANPATSGDAIKLLFGTVLTPATVVRALGLVPAYASSEAHSDPKAAREAYYAAVQGLGITLQSDLCVTATALLDALRSGAFDAWCAGEPHEILVEFSNGGDSASVTIYPPSRRGALHMSFGFETGKPINRLIRIQNEVFRDLAALLGALPTETAIPPLPH
jgi:hypothetical protein